MQRCNSINYSTEADDISHRQIHHPASEENRISDTDDGKHRNLPHNAGDIIAAQGSPPGKHHRDEQHQNRENNRFIIQNKQQRIIVFVFHFLPPDLKPQRLSS